MTDTQQTAPEPTDLASIGARAIPEFEGVHDVWPRGARLRAVRDAATAYKKHFASQGQVHAVKSVDIADVPTTSPESLALSKGLKRRGFGFVGPTTMFALMEALGIVDTHLLESHRRGTSGVWPD